MAAAPRIVTRREWGAQFPVPGGRFVLPASRRFFVVHWPVIANVSDERAVCRTIERMHRQQGWAAVPGYNYLVGQSGTIYEGCGRDVRGIHSPPRNTDGWGVCCLQPCTPQGRPLAPVSQAMRNSTRALYDWLGSVAGRNLNMWWHGRDFATMCPGPDLIAWVRNGMQASGVAPSPGPSLTEEETMTSEVAANGNFHVWMIGTGRRTVWFTVQRGGETAWGGGQPGRGPAGWSRFWDAPQGRTVRGITARVSRGGVLHFWATLDNGDTLYTFQRPNENEWRGGTATSRLGQFAPAP
jgi:hypothetical protein